MGLTISCDECSMQGASVCHDCVVTFLLRDEEQREHEVELDGEQARVVQLFGAAGMVPRLRYRTLA